MRTRNHYNTHISGEAVACILMGAVIAGILIGLAGGIITMLSSDDAYTRCLVINSHDTCAYTLR